MHLVEYDGSNIGNARARDEHISQNLGCHDDYRRLSVQADVAGEQSNLVTVQTAVVTIFLVAERLDRGGVERSQAKRAGLERAEVGDDRLASAGRGGHQYGVAIGERLNRLQLETVQRVRQRGKKLL